MLLAPPTPTHAHEDRVPHSRALSPPSNSSHSPPSPAHVSTKRRSTPPRPPLMNDVSSNHYTPSTSSSTHTPTQGRSPQTSHTPTTPTGERVSLTSSGMGLPPSSQSMPAVTSSAGSFGVLSVAGAPNPIAPVSGGGGPPQTPPIHHPLLGYVPHGNKILSRNLNGTLAVTTQPSNESELQLYRVLQRANLLTYYDTFISQGGDDVQQLCEAGEEEFLEIMALVGMASKPLHVRRLQKALQEWVSNPLVAGFPSFAHRSLMPNSTPSTRPSPPINPSNLLQNHSSSPGKEPLTHNSNSLGGSTSPRDGGPPTTPINRDGGIAIGIIGGHSGSRGPSPGMPPSSIHMNSTGHLPPMQNCQGGIGPDKNPEFFLQIMKMIMNMSDDDPRRMEEIRKYAAIYGRFDCKRKPEKPLTMHEVSVNEAAAQICKYMPALLTRRDELFPLARQVVRDSGYQYSKGHSRSQTVIGREEEQRHKRTRLDSSQDQMDYKQDHQWKKRHERLEAISDELRAMSEKAEDVRNSLTSGSGNVADLTQQMDAIHTRHAQLTLEQSELMKAQQKSYSARPRSERSCSDDVRNEDSDSQFSYSANNSPSQVISSSQGNIIAVANPALSLSSAMPTNHSHMAEDERHLGSLYNVSQQNHSSSTRNNSIKQEPNSPPGNPKQD